MQAAATTVDEKKENKTDMVNLYLAAGAADRARIYSILNEQEKRRLYDLETQQKDALNRSFEQELQAMYNAITANLAVDSAARHCAMKMYEEIKSCWKSKGYIPSSLVSDTYLRETVRRTTDLVSTPPTSSEFTHRSEAFIHTMKNIRNEGILNVIGCIGATLATLMLLAGAALIVAATFGAFSEPFRIGLQTISALGAAATASASYLPSMLAVDQYVKARDKLSFWSKMDDLSEAMTATQPRPK